MEFVGWGDVIIIIIIISHNELMYDILHADIVLKKHEFFLRNETSAIRIIPFSGSNKAS